MNILLAEDDNVSRRILAAQLGEMGYEIQEAEDGLLAWEAFQNAKPHLVITDWMMPNVDGPELCRRIRNWRGSGYTYIIILTALDRNQGYLDGMNAGADDFITKPANIGELHARLKVAQRILSLQKHVSKLEGLLPICPRCKKIRATRDKWEPVESFIMKHSDALFSHGICPECYETVIQPQLDDLRRRTATERKESLFG
jgi:sigma-B regulation protein RsbU (phosphoserine phosphatase)